MKVFSRFLASVAVGASSLAYLAGAFAEEHISQLQPTSWRSLNLVLKEEGGFAYRHKVYTLNFNDLSKDNKSKLTSIFSETGILKEHGLKKISGAADAITYTISVSEDSNKHEAEFDDATISDSYRRLVDFIAKTGKIDTKSESN